MTTPTKLYRHWDNMDNLLYVGISKSVLQRLGTHETNSHWYDKIAKVTIESFPTRKLALAAEKLAIETECPLYNRQYNSSDNLPVIHTFLSEKVDEPYWYKLTSTAIGLIDKFREDFSKLPHIKPWSDLTQKEFDFLCKFNPEYAKSLRFDCLENHYSDRPD
jgi:hypothetical protein